MTTKSACIPLLFIALVGLAGCNGTGGTPASVAPSTGFNSLAIVHSAVGTGPVSDPSLGVRSNQGQPLVYVALVEINAIEYFSQLGHKQPLLGRITTGVASPGQLFVVPNGDLYVANEKGGTVPVFRKGAKAPYKVLTGFGSGAFGVTADDRNTVFVGSGNVINLFVGGSTKPTSKLRIAKPNFVTNLAANSKGDLFVQTATGADTGASVEMFPAGSKKAVVLPITTESAGGLAVDKRDNLIVCDDGLQDGFTGGIYAYAPPYTSGPIYSKSLTGGTTGCATSKTLDRVWAAEEGNFQAAAEYTPDLHLLDQVADGRNLTTGIAVDP